MTPFLPDKVTPPAERPRISRPRLLATLRESLDSCNSTIIYGRTGTGKTTLAADFAQTCGRRAAWYKVDAPDADLPTFFQYLCASVATMRPDFGRKTLELLADESGAEDVPLLVEHLVYELQESSAPLLVVIDDLHLIYDAEWVVPFFRRLLPLLPAEVHFMLIGRSAPPNPLWRMRSKQTLCVVDEQSLAFTLAEARKLFTSYGLPAEAAEGTLIQTRGRASLLAERARSTAAASPEATGYSHGRDGRRTGRLRLVKGINPKSSLGAA